VSTHYVRFTRHAVTGETRATCTCGSSFCSDRETAIEWGKYHNRHGELPEQTPSAPARYESGLE
jgi:hypothetical protein